MGGGLSQSKMLGFGFNRLLQLFKRWSRGGQEVGPGVVINKLGNASGNCDYCFNDHEGTYESTELGQDLQVGWQHLGALGLLHSWPAPNISQDP